MHPHGVADPGSAATEPASGRSPIPLPDIAHVFLTKHAPPRLPDAKQEVVLLARDFSVTVGAIKHVPTADIRSWAARGAAIPFDMIDCGRAPMVGGNALHRRILASGIITAYVATDAEGFSEVWYLRSDVDEILRSPAEMREWFARYSRKRDEKTDEDLTYAEAAKLAGCTEGSLGPAVATGRVTKTERGYLSRESVLAWAATRNRYRKGSVSGENYTGTAISRDHAAQMLGVAVPSIPVLLARDHIDRAPDMKVDLDSVLRYELTRKMRGATYDEKRRRAVEMLNNPATRADVLKRVQSRVEDF